LETGFSLVVCAKEDNWSNNTDPVGREMPFRKNLSTEAEE
jgi:hypothetical protein